MPPIAVTAHELLAPDTRDNDDEESPSSEPDESNKRYANKTRRGRKKPKPIRSRLRAEAAMSEDMKLLHGSIKLEEQPVDINKLLFGSFSHAQQSSATRQNFSYVYEDGSSQINVSLNNVRSRLVKLSEYLK